MVVKYSNFGDGLRNKVKNAISISYHRLIRGDHCNDSDTGKLLKII